MTRSAGGAGDSRPAMAAQPEVEAIGTADAAACKALSDAAGWTHSLDDWRLRLATGRGFGIRRDGRLVSVGLLLIYPGRAAFFGMLLTNPAERGRGLGVRLSRYCIDWAHERDLPCCLIAVPKAVPLYRRLGMREIPGQGLASFRFANGLAGESIPAGLRPARPTDAAAIAALDVAALGYGRAVLVLDVLQRGAAWAWVAEEGGRLSGFSLGVERGPTMALGPTIARERLIGRALLRAQLAMLPQAAQVRLDVPLAAEEFTTGLGLPAEPSATRLAFMASHPVTGLPYARSDMVFAALSAIAG